MNQKVSCQQWFMELAIRVAFLTNMSSHIAYDHNKQSIPIPNYTVITGS